MLVALAAVLAATLAVPASAGVPAGEPSCSTTAKYNWIGNCWVSWLAADPDRISDFTTGIQMVLSYNGSTFDDPGGIDGCYGTNSRRGVRAFQSLRQLLVDRVVGSNTWQVLQWDIGSAHSAGGWHYYELPRGSHHNWKLKENASTGQWYVKSPRRGWTFQRMDRTRA